MRKKKNKIAYTCHQQLSSGSARSSKTRPVFLVESDVFLNARQQERGQKLWKEGCTAKTDSYYGCALPVLPQPQPQPHLVIGTCIGFRGDVQVSPASWAAASVKDSQEGPFFLSHSFLLCTRHGYSESIGQRALDQAQLPIHCRRSSSLSSFLDLRCLGPLLRPGSPHKRLPARLKQGERLEGPDYRRYASSELQPTDHRLTRRQRVSFSTSLTSSPTAAFNSPSPKSRTPTLACPSLS